MIFSNKIHKIIDGENVSLFSTNGNELNLYILNKSLKMYIISTNSNLNCVFSNNYNGQKIIELNDNFIAIGSNDFITIMNKNDLWKIISNKSTQTHFFFN